VFADRYDLHESLGSGRLGEVYRAWDNNQGFEVALKVFRRSVPGLAFREAALLTALQGDHILRVHNADVDNDVPFIATEVAPLGSAADYMDKVSWLPINVAVTWIRHVLKGLTVCHSRGLLHRDIKPENLFVASPELALLGDFGLVGRVNDEGVAEASGTPLYTAPEGHTDGIATVRSDIYSVGLTAWSLLTGTEPFSWYDERDLGGDLLSAGIGRRLRDEAPHVPRALALLVERALEVDPAARFSSANEMDHALGKLSLPRHLWTEVRPSGPATRQWVCTGRSIQVQATESEDGKSWRVVTSHAGSGRRILASCFGCSTRAVATRLRRVFDKS
jgi:serine/threonine protein kinase